MVFCLLWFSGIDGDTLVRDIGWFYVALVLLIVVLIFLIRDFIKTWKRGFDD